MSKFQVLYTKYICTNYNSSNHKFHSMKFTFHTLLNPFSPFKFDCDRLKKRKNWFPFEFECSSNTRLVYTRLFSIRCLRECSTLASKHIILKASSQSKQLSIEIFNAARRKMIRSKIIIFWESFQSAANSLPLIPFQLCAHCDRPCMRIIRKKKISLHFCAMWLFEVMFRWFRLKTKFRWQSSEECVESFVWNRMDYVSYPFFSSFVLFSFFTRTSRPPKIGASKTLG